MDVNDKCVPSHRMESNGVLCTFVGLNLILPLHRNHMGLSSRQRRFCLHFLFTRNRFKNAFGIWKVNSTFCSLLLALSSKTYVGRRCMDSNNLVEFVQNRTLKNWNVSLKERGTNVI